VILFDPYSHPELPVPVDIMIPDDLNLPRSLPSATRLYEDVLLGSFSAIKISFKNNFSTIFFYFSKIICSPSVL
jgi:hypothetical protein